MNKFSESDLWDELYSSLTPLLGEGEKTLGMIMKDLAAKDMGHSENTARRWIKKWVQQGKLRYIGRRRIEGEKHGRANAWMVVKSPKNGV